jgi:carbonic anhydrase
MPDELLQRLQRFQTDAFPLQRSHFRLLVDDGQHPMTLFIGCSDSRLVPYLLTGAGPGELFLVRNVGAFVPPHDQSQGFHGTAAAIEFAVLNLSVSASWCAVTATAAHPGLVWRCLTGGQAPVAVAGTGPRSRLAGGRARPEVLRRTEQRAVVLQLERLMDYPMVRERVEAGTWPARLALRDRRRRGACLRRAARRLRACGTGRQRRHRAVRGAPTRSATG